MDPDPAVFLKADPDPGQTWKSQKVNFLHEKYNEVLYRRSLIGQKQTSDYEGPKAFWKAENQVFY